MPRREICKLSFYEPNPYTASSYMKYFYSVKKNHILIYQFCHFHIPGFFKIKFIYSAVKTAGFLTILKVLHKGVSI